MSVSLYSVYHWAVLTRPSSPAGEEGPGDRLFRESQHIRLPVVYEDGNGAQGRVRYYCWLRVSCAPSGIGNAGCEPPGQRETSPPLFIVSLKYTCFMGEQIQRAVVTGQWTTRTLLADDVFASRFTETICRCYHLYCYYSVLIVL